MSLTPREDIKIPEAALAAIEADAREAVNIAESRTASFFQDRQDAVMGPLAAAIFDKITVERDREHTRLNEEQRKYQAARTPRL